MIDVTEDEQALQFVKGMGYQGVPVIVPDFKQEVFDENGERVGHWGGFNPDYLDQL